jgi:hypothetical protein
MSNNVLNQGLAPQFVAAETLRTLVPVLAPLNKIVTTDFSAYVAERGQVVHTRFANKFTANTYVRANGFVSSDADATDVAITLADHKYVQASFDDTEVATISLDMLRRVFIAPMANATVKSLFDGVIGLTTEANFEGLAYSGTKANFNRVAIAGAATRMTKANLPFDGRSLLLTPDAFGQLLQDASVAQYLSIGDTSVIRDGKVGRLHGIDIYEYNGFPGSGTTFTEKLNGIASCKEGHVLVTRVPAAPTTGGGEQITVQDPDSGFAFALRSYYDWSMGLSNISASWITGESVGNPDAALRVVISDL